MESIHFEIVSTGFNCQANIENLVRCLQKQTYKNWNATLVSDGSTDSTARRLANVFNKKITCKAYKKNTGAAYRRWQVISNLPNKNSVILLLGLDDLLMANCLEVIATAYRDGAMVTYGNWINQNGSGLPKDFMLDFPDHVHAERNYRKEIYRSTAPNTFYKYLFDAIPVEDFMIEGSWIQTTTESELMFSCLEMAGKNRIKFFTEPLYIYNQGKHSVAYRLGQQYKNNILEIIKSRPKKPLYESIECLS